MLYFSALLMLKCSIWWRPSMLGGRLFLPLLRSCFRILLYLFRKKLFFIFALVGEKSSGAKYNSSYQKRSLLLGGMHYWPNTLKIAFNHDVSSNHNWFVMVDSIFILRNFFTRAYLLTLRGITACIHCTCTFLSNENKQKDDE